MYSHEVYYSRYNDDDSANAWCRKTRKCNIENFVSKRDLWSSVRRSSSCERTISGAVYAAGRKGGPASTLTGEWNSVLSSTLLQIDSFEISVRDTWLLCWFQTIASHTTRRRPFSLCTSKLPANENFSTKLKFNVQCLIICTRIKRKNISIKMVVKFYDWRKLHC